MAEFDAFLSYNSKDKGDVGKIAKWLESRNIKVWYDEWELRPGLPWQAKLEEGILKSVSVVVFIGSTGRGPWQDPEMRAALDESVRRGCPVIPVLLPGCPENPDVALFLKAYTWVDFRNGLDDEGAGKKLLWGITGESPLAETSAPGSAREKARCEEAGRTEGEKEKRPGWLAGVSVFSGLSFLAIMLVIAFFIPEPTIFQIFVFRVVLAIAAAAFGATIPGFLEIKLPLWGKGLISAGGALGLFVLIYQVNPPGLILGTNAPAAPKPAMVNQEFGGTVLDKAGEPLEGVEIWLKEYDVKTLSDERGSFFFEVEGGEKDASARLMARKEGYATYRQDATLGNTNFTFQMEKKP